MLVHYSGARFSQHSRSDQQYSPGLQFSPQQSRHDGYARVLQSTSENIRTPSHMNHAQHDSTKPRAPPVQSESMATRRMIEQLGLPEESEIIYHAFAIKKQEKRKEGDPHPLPKKKITLKIWKGIPAAATTADCNPNRGYYKYRMSAKKDRCGKPWCKKHDPHELWPDEIEKAFQFWIRTIKPMGKKKVIAEVLHCEQNPICKESCAFPGIVEKQCGRNELISYMIYLDTGQVRDRKKISSHIQVLKGYLKRPNDDLFFKDDDENIPAEHDECAMEHEEAGKLLWDKHNRRVVPAPRSSDNKNSMRSSYLLSSRLLEYNPSAVTVSHRPNFPEGSLPRFREMQFQLYVTLKDGPNDKPLHTYTRAQQGACAESLCISDISELHSFFPTSKHLSGALSQGQLFYCDASLMMRHDLTEKGYQVGPEMQVTLSCPHDYNNWCVRTTGYRNRGLELVKSEERACDWQRGAGDQVNVILWASATYWAELLFDCKLAYEGRRCERFSELQPSRRSEAVLEDASFVQEIFATLGSTGEPVRVAVLLWRFRQEADGEAGLWTWRHVKLTPASGLSSSQPSCVHPSAEQIAGVMEIETGNEDGNGDDEDFDFDDLHTGIPGHRQGTQTPGRPSSKRSPEIDWSTIATSAESMHSSVIAQGQFPIDDTLRLNTRLQDEASFVHLDDSTQNSSFSSRPSSACPDAYTPVEIDSATSTQQELAFSFDFDSNMKDLPPISNGWENLNLDFSVIPGLETPAKFIDTDKHNYSFQNKYSRTSLTPFGLAQDLQAQDFGIPIDPVLGTWTTPTTARIRVRPDGSDDDHEDVRPTKRRKPNVARALTYLPPVPQAHVLKSTQEGPESNVDQTTPTKKLQDRPNVQVSRNGEQVQTHDISTLQALPVSSTHGYLELHRVDSQANSYSIQDSRQETMEKGQSPDTASLSTQSFQSVHDVQSDSQTQFRFAEAQNSFVSQPQSRVHAQNLRSQPYSSNAFEPSLFSSQPRHLERSWQNVQHVHAMHNTHSDQSQTLATSTLDSTDADWHEISLFSPTASYNLNAISQAQESAPQARSLNRHSPQHHPQLSPTHSFASIEDLCGDAAQLAHLSYSEVCADGANLAQLAQMHHASMRDVLEQPPPLLGAGQPVFSSNTSFSNNASNSRQRPSLAVSRYPSVQSVHPVRSAGGSPGGALASQTVGTRYASASDGHGLAGLEALVTAAVRAEPGRRGTSGDGGLREEGEVGLEPYHSQPWTSGTGYSGDAAGLDSRMDRVVDGILGEIRGGDEFEVEL